jgi:hypothetical protein
VRIKIDKNIFYGQARAYLNKEIQRSTESYENSILEKLSKAARERAVESAEVKAAILQNENEIEELKNDIKRLVESTKELQELRQQKEQYLQTMRLLEEQQTPAPTPTPTPSTSMVTTRQKTAQNTKQAQMETETNLKRKKSKSKEEIPTKKFTVVINMHNYHSLTNEQLSQIQDLHNNRDGSEPLMYEMDETHTITARRPRDNAERSVAKKIVQWMQNEDEVKKIDESL